MPYLTVACTAGAALVNLCPDSLGPTYLRVKHRYDEVDPANYVTREEYWKRQTGEMPKRQSFAFDPRRPRWYCEKWNNKDALKGTVVTVVEMTETEKKEVKQNRKGKTRSPEEIERESEQRIQKQWELPKDQQRRYIVQKVWKLACFVKSGL